ncbi:threonine dehydrogenase-like Zn-dependent dehydrogenase [Actinoplanes octamycinicus]|uniref:Threonine dehydrogenase-like Zn-dependent dehydrogenase n=1 Tax=Actinoplanes octamycinicus TaxID=135948 RepID=A0A7W7MBC3_9ACTN|nr:alcohol dehydrogenase catalytic domain-containing protein [Actinoplanes octamycinicus]MBB4743867.1 threonine dehydrogenase-like Zn-dependent dehydrogenase [Actinoplanes octamycinicus]GIE58496.1 alcohol dehydrogenase [Actinoplanes octamycinicus]
MRALVFTGPGRAEVRDVPEPQAGPGHVVVEVERVGVCGTDVELFTGEMSYLHTGVASYPLRPGHEWAGTVVAAGPGVDPGWVGRRVTGDTMIGCGECARCRAGRHHVCPARHELGCRDGLPGALAERLAFPAAYLHELPGSVDATLGALVEPGGNALRAVRAAAVAPGERLLIIGTGTIGLLAAMFGRAHGAEVHLLGEQPAESVWTRATLPDLPWDGVIDATNGAGIPKLAVDLVEPGRTVVYIGLAGTPSLVDTREIVLKDVTTVGLLGASAGLGGAITAYAEGKADPRPLVAATVSLEEIVGVLAGKRPPGAGPGPKFHVDPRLGQGR